MQLCSFAGQSGHSVSAGVKMYQALGSLAYCLPHSALNSRLPSPSHAACSLRLLVGAFPAACRRASCLPIQMLAVFRLLACLPPFFFGCLLNFFLGCLPAPLAAYLVFPAACRAPEVACLPSRLLAGFKGCFPSPRAACPPRVIQGNPFSTCSLFVSTCQIVACRLVCFIVYLLSIAAEPARRACSLASPDEFVSRSSSHVV